MRVILEMDMINSLKILIVRDFTKQESSYFVDYKILKLVIDGVLIVTKLSFNLYRSTILSFSVLQGAGDLRKLLFIRRQTVGN